MWSSIPDDERYDAAIQGKLRTPAVLEKQVRRMLADSRSKSLIDNFAEQWLYLRNLNSMTPDMRLFPDFDDNLRQSFRKETELFFEDVLREDRSVLELLDHELHIRERAFGETLRHSECLWQPLSPDHISAGQRSRRATSPRQRLDRDVIRHANFSRNPR